MPNLVEGLLAQIDRNEMLLKAYEEIGPAGMFGAIIIKTRINEAKEAMASGDVVRMLGAYHDLESSE